MKKQKIEGIRCYKQHRTNIKENEELEHICTQNTAYAHQVPKFISIICYSHIRSLFSFYRNVALILWLVLPEFHASWQIIVYLVFCARSSSKKYIYTVNRSSNCIKRITRVSAKIEPIRLPIRNIEETDRRVSCDQLQKCSHSIFALLTSHYVYLFFNLETSTPWKNTMNYV